MFRDDSWFGWWISTRCWSMPRIHVASKWWWFCSDRIDSRTHEVWPSSGREGRVPFGSIRNWSLSQIQEKWQIYLMDCHFQNEQVFERTSRRKRRICLLRRWPLVPAWRTKHKGHSSRQSHLVSKMFVPTDQWKWKIFLPSTTLAEDLCARGSRRQWQRYYDIVVLTEKMMEQRIWNTLLPMLRRD